MTCETARERMLEADPAELRAETTSPLADHIRACPRCAGLADVILEDQAALAAALEGQRAPRSARDVVDAALAAAGRGGAAGEQAHPTARPAVSPADVEPLEAARAGRRFPAGVPAWLPLALAAGLAALLLLAQWDVITPGPDAPGVAPAPDPEPTFAVAAPPDRDVALFETTDPNIKIVWLY